MFTATIVIWALLVHNNAAQPWSPIYSVDIENVAADAKQLRYSNSDQEDDLKELFFRRVQTYEEQEAQNTENPSKYFVDIPQPGGFKNYQENNKRVRRNTNNTKKAESNFEIIGQIQANIEKHLGRPLDVAVLDPNNSTDLNNETGSENNLKTKVSAESEKETGIVGINDFIRFRRDAQPEPKPVARENKIKNSEESVIISHNEKIGELTDLSSFPESQISKNEKQQKTGRMLMQEDDIIPEGSREPRGATKEQWVKQPYPVHSISVDGNNYDDNIPSPSDVSVRAPRVHFVTQRRLESAPPPGNYRNYEREGRSGDFSKEPAREPPRSAPRSPPRKPDRDYYPERPVKHYDPYPPRHFNPYRDDPHYHYEESRYDPQYGPAEYDRYRPEFTSRQRRIIYYATLPEVVRTPPNVNLRDRYSYRDRYDDRYVSSPSLSVAEDNSYRFRKPYPFTKSRYEPEMERTKAPYPLKVSTDVNVGETKKNPERRIYSEPDRRYAHKAPSYHSEESFDHRT